MSDMENSKSDLKLGSTIKSSIAYSHTSNLDYFGHDEYSIKNPAASSGVFFSAQCELIIRMQLLICFTWILHILTNPLFIPMLTNRTCKLTTTPKFPTPPFLLNLKASLENFSCSYALNECTKLGHTLCRH